MAGLGDLFGKGSIAEQIFVWGVLNQVITALGSPYFDLLTQEVNERNPEAVRDPATLVGLVVRGFTDREGAIEEAKRSGLNPAKFAEMLQAGRPYLSPADLGQLVVRGFMSTQAAEEEAVLTGWDAGRLQKLIDIAADAPGPGDLAVALRRGIIPEDTADPNGVSFGTGIRQGRLANKWIPMMKALAVQWPTPTDALQAVLEGQVSEAEGRALYERFGGDLDYFTMLFNTRGNAPTPTEALDLLNRGIITERGTGPASTSYEQAFLEGPWRNKWLDPFLALRRYITPPRSVVAMVRDGAYTDAQAADALAKYGMNAEDIAAYIAEAHQVAAATEKDLTQTSILDLYDARVISPAEAHELLTALGYSGDNATFLIELRDLRRSIAAVNTAVARVHTLYTGRKINRDTAVSVLHSLAVPDDQSAELLHTWDLEASVNIKQLTESQITQAWLRDALTLAEAMSELVTIGYTQFDAWVLLSIANKEPLDGKPARGPNPVGVIP